jgi:hypothetical protein
LERRFVTGETCSPRALDPNPKERQNALQFRKDLRL